VGVSGEGGVPLPLVLQSLALVVLGVLVYVVTRLLGIRCGVRSFPHARNTALQGLGAVFAGWVGVSALFLAFARSPAAAATKAVPRDYGPRDVVNAVVIVVLAFGPARAVMHWRRESWASAGVSTHNLVRSLVVGMLLGGSTLAATFLQGSGGLRRLWAGSTGGPLWALLYFAVVGFGEEFAFRGYLQTRLMAWLGRWWGWVAASILMALARVVQRTTGMGMSPAEALGSSAALIPISLFLGYVMMRTDNVVAPGLAHTFANWAGTLG
jgi:membrane protease YdiL (CAAX protease family)